MSLYIYIFYFISIRLLGYFTTFQIGIPENMESDVITQGKGKWTSNGRSNKSTLVVCD